MLLTIDDIKEKFSELIVGKISREEADRWAYERMQALDSGSLIFQPACDEEFLWSAIQYLYGVDTKDSPDEYMHSLEDIQKKFAQKRYKNNYTKHIHSSKLYQGDGFLSCIVLA